MIQIIKRSIIVLFIVSINAISSFSVSDSLVAYHETYYTGHTPLDSTYSITQLASTIDEVLSKYSKFLNKTDYGIGVYSIKSKKWYYKRNVNNLLTPASTTKLFTTYTLLRRFGKDFNISTEVYHDGTLLANGTLNGNIYILGKGDALFSTNDLEVLADKVANSGIKKINGKVIADGTFYDDMYERIIYSEDNDVVQATPPITSLNIDRNTATIIVTSGGKSGVAPNVHIIPSSDSYVIINKAIVGSVTKKRKSSRRRKSTGSIDKLIDTQSSEPINELIAGDFSINMLASASAGISVTTKMLPDGKQQFVISGTIRPNSTYSYQHLIHNPPLTIAGAFKNRLKAGGISITGDIGVVDRKVSDSLQRRYIFINDFKRPVVDLVNITNKESDNYLAEILFKMIGANAGHHHNNAPATRSIMDSIFFTDSIRCIKCLLNDGSGLSRRNRVTVESMVNILVKAKLSDIGNAFMNSLSVASLDGTLKKRFKVTSAEKNIKAKTGTLRNVSALAGYVTTHDDDELAFTFIFNGPNVGAYKQIENDLGKSLSDFFIQEVSTEMLNKK